MEHPPCLQTIVFLMIFFETVCVTTASQASLSQQTNFIQIFFQYFSGKKDNFSFFNLAARACKCEKSANHGGVKLPAKHSIFACLESSEWMEEECIEAT